MRDDTINVKKENRFEKTKSDHNILTPLHFCRQLH